MTPSPTNSSGWLSRHSGEIGLMLAILVVVVATATVNDSYRQKPVYNLTEILRQTSLLGIFALGAGVVIISGGIDLSSGSVIALSGAVCASIIFALSPLDASKNPDTSNISSLVLVAAVVGTLFVGFLIGSFHAWLVTVIGLPPFVATLASLVGLRSLARVMIQDVTQALAASGRSTQIYIYDDVFNSLGRKWWIPLAIFLLLAVITWILMSRTVVGRHLYAMGGNEEAARLSGIRTDRVKWLAYTVGSVTASIAGILFTSYIGMSSPETQGVGYELNAIAAAVVGGCSLMGGIGTVTGTILGALFLRVVIDSVAKTMKTNPDEFEGLIVGILVILAVAFNELRDTGGLRKQFFPGGLGVVNIFVLTLLAGVITAVMTEDNKRVSASIAAVSVLILLCAKKFFEVSAIKK